MRLFRHLLLLLGLVITQTVKAEPTAKAIWTEGNTTMTFVYDETPYNVYDETTHKPNDTYDDVPITKVWEGNSFQQAEWYNTVSSSLTQVVFAESFNEARPTSCAYWFRECTKLSTIKGLSNLNTNQVTTMAGMFYGCQSLKSLDVSGFITSRVTTMWGMFSECQSLKSLDVSSFNTSQVTTMEGMFSLCQSLESLDVSGFNTSQVTDMKGMFYGCKSLKSLDVSGFNTSQVTTMERMFYKCHSLESLDVSGFNTSKVTTMSGMFYKCSALTTLDLSSFNTDQVTNMSYMFGGCSNLTTITVSNGWNTGAVTASDASTDMFKDCTTKLVGGKGTTFNSSNPTDKTYARVDKEGTPGYLTLTKDVFILNITSAGMATLYFDGNLAIPDNVEVFYCSSINNKGEVTAHKLGEAIPASTGVYVEGVAGCYILRKPDASVVVPEITNNIMTGTLEETSPAPRTVLTLGHERSTGELGFHYFTGNKISAFKAYIPVEKISASAPAISFFPIKYFEDEATGISKLTEIGKVEDDAIYDLAGRKVKAATKGIFIKNGKKFIVK